MAEGKCFVCEQTGHRSNTCPKRRTQQTNIRSTTTGPQQVEGTHEEISQQGKGGTTSQEQHHTAQGEITQPNESSVQYIRGLISKLDDDTFHQLVNNLDNPQEDFQ